MPHVSGGRSGTASSVDSRNTDDLASADEVKVYKDEGEDEKRSSENLIEDKLGLVTESEEGKSSERDDRKRYLAEENPLGLFSGLKAEGLLSDRFPFGYPFIPPYPPFSNGSSIASPGKLFGSPPGIGLWDSIVPPPAHMGITPLHLDLKSGLARHPLYGLHPAAAAAAAGLYPPELAHLQWGVSPGTPFRPYPPPSPLSWLGAPGLLPGVSHPAVVTPGPPSSLPHDLSPFSDQPLDHSSSREQPFFLSKHLDSVHSRLNGGSGLQLSSSPYSHSPHHHHPHHHQAPGPQQSKKSMIKKPLNAFMIFMKEMRQTVIEECSLKESAAINQILGRRWHSLDRSEQSKYYEMARKEKELHMKMYPGWSARDNYATHAKRKKLKQHQHGGSHQQHHQQQQQQHSGSSNHSNAGSSQSFDSSEHASSPSSKRFKSHYDNDDERQDWGAAAARSDAGSVEGRGENTSLLINSHDHLTNVSLNDTLTPSTPSRITV